MNQSLIHEYIENERVENELPYLVSQCIIADPEVFKKEIFCENLDGHKLFHIAMTSETIIQNTIEKKLKYENSKLWNVFTDMVCAKYEIEKRDLKK